MQLKISEMPRVHASGFLKTDGDQRNKIFDWLQMDALFFRTHGAYRMRTCTIQISNQIKQKQNNLQTELFRGKGGVEKVSQTLLTQENSDT